MIEEGVTIINGSDVGRRLSMSRSPSPSHMRRNSVEEERPKKFLNGWSKEQERLMAEWSDIASCYRWLHDKSEKVYHTKVLWINLPVIILSTLGGTANFGIQSVVGEDESLKKYVSFGIGGISLFAGLLTTVGNYLRYAQLEESHRVAGIAWGKFQRLIAVELAVNPNDRIDSLDFLKICRADLDRLIEQSPPIPKESIALFERKFGSIKDLKKPDICGSLEHTSVFQSSESRLKQAAVEAALLLRRKKQALSELVTPEIEKKIASQIETRLSEAIEARKKNLEEEIEMTQQEQYRENKEREKALEERKRKIQEEIELEKKKLYGDFTVQSLNMNKPNTTQFENRIQTVLHHKRSSMKLEPIKIEKRITAHDLITRNYNNNIENNNNEENNNNNDNIIIVNKV